MCRWLAFVLLLPASMVQAEDIQPGMWDITLNTTIANGQAIGPIRHSQCLTKEDAQNPEKLFAEAGAQCTYGDKRIQGNRFSFQIQCTGTLEVSGSGWVEHTVNQFHGEMLLAANLPNVGPIETRSQVNGVRQGNCR